VIIIYATILTIMISTATPADSINVTTELHELISIPIVLEGY